MSDHMTLQKCGVFLIYFFIKGVSGTRNYDLKEANSISYKGQNFKRQKGVILF